MLCFSSLSVIAMLSLKTNKRQTYKQNHRLTADRHHHKLKHQIPPLSSIKVNVCSGNTNSPNWRKKEIVFIQEMFLFCFCLFLWFVFFIYYSVHIRFYCSDWSCSLNLWFVYITLKSTICGGIIQYPSIYKNKPLQFSPFLRMQWKEVKTNNTATHLPSLLERLWADVRKSNIENNPHHILTYCLGVIYYRWRRFGGF